MSQVFDITKPISGTTKLSQLYQIIRDHDQANRSSFSGATAPDTPVVGQLWEDTANDKLFLYTNASGWSEVAVGNTGLGQEIIVARGDHTQLDNRLDVALNEDGTLKASTSLNPSEWFDVTVASGYVSTTSFRAYGADYTTVYHPLRRLKVNRAAGTYYTEVVSSSYSSPNTTVVTRDAVISTDLEYVSHSIVDVRKASAGDGAVSFEMISNLNTSSGGASLNIGDSVVFANGTGTTTLKSVSDYGAGRPIFLVNIHASQSHTFAAYSGQTINGAASVTIGPGQSIIVFNNGSAWYIFNVPNILSGTITGTYTLGGTPTITAPIIASFAEANHDHGNDAGGGATIAPTAITVAAWTDVSSFGTGWSASSQVSYLKDPFGWVRMKGTVSSAGIHSLIFNIPDGYRPAQGMTFYCANNVTSGVIPVNISTNGNIAPVADAVTVSFDGINFKAAAT